MSRFLCGNLYSRVATAENLLIPRCYSGGSCGLTVESLFENVRTLEELYGAKIARRPVVWRFSWKFLVLIRCDVRQRVATLNLPVPSETHPLIG